MNEIPLYLQVLYKVKNLTEENDMKNLINIALTFKIYPISKSISGLHISISPEENTVMNYVQTPPKSMNLDIL